jgi:Domain of unknown function (DUF4251)
MKQLFYKMGLYLLILLAGTMIARSQSKEPAENQRIIESKNYIFTAQSASPQRGRDIPLTGEYDLTIAGDSIISYLPYFGRAYTAPLDPSKGGIMFTSVNSDYKVTPKKGKWEITIKPKDVTDVQELFLDIFDNGAASLRVTLQNRQPISFTGYVAEGKDRTKKGF